MNNFCTLATPKTRKESEQKLIKLSAAKEVAKQECRAMNFLLITLVASEGGR